MMQRFLTLFFLLFSSVLLSKVTVYFNYGVFNTPNSKPYLETYLTISGQSVKFSPIKGGYQASVNVSWKIVKGTEIVKASNYNLMSPTTLDTLHLPSFIDNQRFSLENGEYTLELVVSDNAYPDQKTTHTEKITIFYKRNKQIYSSDIQILESFNKTTTPNVTSKNGYDLIPYNINYFPKTHNALKFYTETYNVDSVLGKKSKFVYSYYIENSETLLKQRDLAGFQKQFAGIVNPLLAQLDISKLSSGNYNLVIEVKDSANIVQFQKKWFFQRQGNSTEDLSISSESLPLKIKTVEDFFNAYQSQDTLKQFVECLWPRSSVKEREWQQTQLVKKDPNLMRSYLVDYWKTEAGDSLDPLKIWMTYYQSVLEANALLKCGKQKGYYTDRGRVYLQYGKPDQRNQVNSEPTTYPYEIWHYYRLYDKTTGRFFTNKRFVFANFAIADDCYQLIHSEVKGEMYDERWKFKLTRRSQQSGNLDDTNPSKTYGSSIDENFNNPR
jgi:GWxTD domain-containing protein